ncbi:MAG TPA: hypothetical protein VF076_07120 [Acidimicrobiales bacterium]
MIDNLDAGMGYSRRITGAPANGYAYALPGFTRSPGGIFSPAGKLTEIALPTSGWTPAWIVDSARFRDQLYLLTNTNYVLRLAPDGLSAVVDTVLPINFGARGITVFQNKMYLAGGLGLAYMDGVTGAWSGTATSVVRRFLAVVNWRPLGVPTDVLVGVIPGTTSTVDQVTWCPSYADPMLGASWSAPIPVGADPRYNVSKLVTAPRHVYLLRPDGVYDIDELGTRAFNIAPWVAEASDNYNGSWGLHLGDGLYYGHAHGLAFVPTTGETQYRPEWAHPGWGLPYEGPVRGLVGSGTLHSGWGLVGMMSDKGYICAGRRDPEGAWGQATHIWHGAEAVVDGYIHHMKPYTLEWTGDQPKLLVTSTAPAPTTVRLFWQSLPRTGSAIQEMLTGGGFVPADAASLFLPADPWDRPSSVKTLLQFDMVTERLTQNDVLKAYAQADEQTAWASYGTADDGSYSTFMPLETTEGRYIRTRVDAVGHPILRSLELRSAVGVELREARQYRVILAWDNALSGGARGRETADPERRLADLRSLLGRVCTLDDGAMGGTSRVRVLQVLPGSRMPMGGPARAGAAGAVGAWAITAEVTVSVLERPFRWDRDPSVNRYDKDRVWT